MCRVFCKRYLPPPSLPHQVQVRTECCQVQLAIESAHLTEEGQIVCVCVYVFECGVLSVFLGLFNQRIIQSNVENRTEKMIGNR